MAALVIRQGGEQALMCLARSCDDATAFTWWWSVACQNGDRFASARYMPDRIDVPGNLVDAVSTHVLVPLAEGVGLVHDFSPRTNEHLRRMLTKQRDSDVLAAACRWVRRLDLDGDSADLERAELILDAEDARAHRQPDLNSLRHDLARRHAQLAEDTALDGDQRVAHLQMAVQLDAPTARAAALRLVQSPTMTVRLAAAITLVETMGSPDEHGALAALAAAEDDAQIVKHLQAALHRLVSGDVGERCATSRGCSTSRSMDSMPTC